MELPYFWKIDTVLSTCYLGESDPHFQKIDLKIRDLGLGKIPLKVSQSKARPAQYVRGGFWRDSAMLNHYL